MGFFFTPKPPAQITNAAFESALRRDPASIPDIQLEARNQASTVSELLQKEISWPRLGVAILLLGGLFLAAIYTGYHEPLEDLHAVLNHSFEILGGESRGC